MVVEWLICLCFVLVGWLLGLCLTGALVFPDVCFSGSE